MLKHILPLYLFFCFARYCYQQKNNKIQKNTINVGSQQVSIPSIEHCMLGLITIIKDDDKVLIEEDSPLIFICLWLYGRFSRKNSLVFLC